MRIDELDYDLPAERVAKEPLEQRDAARLMLVEGGAISHRTIRDLPSVLPRPALLIFNDTRVFPCRLIGRRDTGGKVEIFLLEKLESIGEDGREERWLVMGRASKKLAEGQCFTFGDRLSVELGPRNEDGLFEATLSLEAPSRGTDPSTIDEAIDALGMMPLPPYMQREASELDRERYQTIFAEHRGAVAAPTAGLHFSDALLEELKLAGHRFATITLHVGLGTFRPVKVDDLDEHPMHRERYYIPEETAEAIASAREEGREILSVGTTVTRALEASAREHGVPQAGAATTDLLIQPGFEFRVIDALLTNFHLPRSTLLALVMAFGGIETIRAAYRMAIEEKYRFFSYGDAMLIRPDRGARK